MMAMDEIMKKKKKRRNESAGQMSECQSKRNRIYSGAAPEC